MNFFQNLYGVFYTLLKCTQIEISMQTTLVVVKNDVYPGEGWCPVGR